MQLPAPPRPVCAYSLPFRELRASACSIASTSAAALWRSVKLDCFSPASGSGGFVGDCEDCHVKFPAPPRPALVYGPQGEFGVDGNIGLGGMEEENGEMGVAAGAYWSASWVGEMEEEYVERM